MPEFVIITQFDEPQGEIEHLGIKKTFQTLSQFLTSNSIVTPMSIAIHGEWGSGKTNLLRALEKNLDKSKSHVIFFEAWKYESGDPSVALISTIAKELAEKNEVGVNMIRLAVNAFIKKNLDMSLDELVSTLRAGFDATENLSKYLSSGISKKLNNRKLVILIDDLDRCDVENTLSILAIMKLFLDIPNCICVAAVDFHRLEQAWFSKYGIKDDDVHNPYKLEGRQYLEKIFQVRVPIPSSDYDERKTFLEKIAPNMPLDLLNLISKIGPANPRGIKRMLNLASYRTFLIEGTDASSISLLWTLLEEILLPENACRLYEKMESQTNFLNEFFITPRTWDDLRSIIGQLDPTIFQEPRSIDRFKTFFESCKLIFTNIGGSGEWANEFKKLYQSSNQLQS